MILYTLIIILVFLIQLQAIYKWYKLGIKYGIIRLILSIIVLLMAMYMFAIPFIVVDTNNKTIEGILTNVEKNWYGTYTIYIRTDKNEKYCVENKDIINMANELIGREVIIGKGTREGMYGITKCHEAPITHIERVKDVQSSN